MNHHLTTKRQIGINFHMDAPASVKVWAPKARKVCLQIENGKRIDLNRQLFGFWTASSKEIQPGQRYCFEINGNKSYPDPASLSQPDGVNQSSETLDLEKIREIRDKDWRGFPLHELIIYELHVGSFSAEGNFEGATKKLDHLAELGVNTIEIMPVSSFPGNRNWGYDGVFPFSVQNNYGGAFELVKFVNACHKKGFAVILDVVYNHLGPEGNYFNVYGPYFTNKYSNIWGRAINFDDAWCDGVRDFFMENAMMWLRDFHIDGLRLDAVHTIMDDSPKHFVRELSENVQKLNKETGMRHFLVGESDANDSKYITPVKDGGYGLASQWCDEWHHSLHALLTGEKQGYYSDFGQVKQLAKSYRHAFVHDGVFSSFRKKIHGNSTHGIPGSRFVIYTQNHDQTGNRLLGERMSSLVDFESLKLAAAAMIFSPFVPMLFMGEEYAENNPFMFFVDLQNPALKKKIKNGRKREFKNFWNKQVPPDPFDIEVFERSKPDWTKMKEKPHNQMFSFYKECISIRKDNPFMKSCNREHLMVRETSDDKAIVLLYQTRKKGMMVMMNFSDEIINESIPEDDNYRSEMVLYSAHKKWGGSVDDNTKPVKHGTGQTNINLKPKSVVVLKFITG